MSKDPRYEPELLARRLCGKSGTLEDLARASGLNPDSLGKCLRRMRDDGHPIKIEPHPISGLVYSYEKPQRVCAHPGCGTKLSRYNYTDYCAAHARAEDLPQKWFVESGIAIA